jgi:hypothetical protein
MIHAERDLDGHEASANPPAISPMAVIQLPHARIAISCQVPEG